jgi:hypothetical protein
LLSRAETSKQYEKGFATFTQKHKAGNTSTTTVQLNFVPNHQKSAVMK